MSAISDDWYEILKDEFKNPCYITLHNKLIEESHNNVIFPNPKEIFTAFNATPFNKVKVVILGQDPYHGKGQAHGLSFSVKPNVKIPPSLSNIYKELHNDLGCYIPNNGYLVKWANQGVLLMNTVLTVRANQPNSHKGIGWEHLTDAVIKLLNERNTPTVFILWGKFAQAKEKMLTNKVHLILKAPHPSPYSANTGFFGCKHFSKTNKFLEENNLEKIDWQIENI